MRRFLVNRSWIFILVLLMALAPRPAHASVSRTPVVQYTLTNTTSYGDPDDPMAAPTKKGQPTPRNRIGTGPSVRPGGDVGRYGSVWMWRLRTVFRALPSVYLRF